MNAVVIFVTLVAWLFGGTIAEDPMEVVFTGSNPSTGGLLGCKYGPGRKASVRFQAVRTGGVEYSRVLVPSNRMTFSDVVATDLGSLTVPECAKAAKEKQLDVFSVENGQCVGYTIGDGLCPCTNGDFVIYRSSNAIRSTSSAKASTVAIEREEATPLPVGYTRKIIYPSVSMTGDNFESSSSSCESVLADESIPDPTLLHFTDGRCYYTDAFTDYPCNSCPGTATSVIVKEDLGSPTYLLSNCGKTIAAQLIPGTGLVSQFVSYEFLISHEGYGCIPYPNPASDDNCNVTIIAPTGADAILVGTRPGYLDIDESADGTCDGDELYVFDGSGIESPCSKKEDFYRIIFNIGDRVTIRFQRKPANNVNSVKKGFVLVVSSLDFDA